jgi:uncharacterized protein
MAQLNTLGTATKTRVEVVNAFMRGVYQWMSLGLIITAVLSYVTAHTPALLSLIFNAETGSPTLLFWALLIGELIMVMVIAGAINKLSATTASGLFVLYSALNGVTLSFIFMVYTQASIVSTFFICAAMFGAMSVYGLVTKKDLTSWGSFLFMGLIGVIIASVVNIFLQSSAMHFIIGIVGVLVFTGLTAYDTQQLKVMGESAPSDDATAVRRGTILGALRLYLDFINLFLMLLRLFGGSRN